jgi:hypothetical protein
MEGLSLGLRGVLVAQIGPPFPGVGKRSRPTVQRPACGSKVPIGSSETETSRRVMRQDKVAF